MSAAGAFFDSVKEVAMPPKVLTPVEDVFHKYPVLKIPTGKRNELLIIGMEKAEAIIRHFSSIEAFHSKHKEIDHGSAQAEEKG